MLQEMIEQWQKALQIEASELKKANTSKYPVTKGKRIAVIGEDYYYFFHSPVELPLRDDIPIRLFYQEIEYYGEVVSSLGDKILIKIQTSLGSTIKDAHLISEPWELLLALSRQLDNLSQTKHKRIRALMTGKAPANHLTKEGVTQSKEALFRAWYNKTTYIWGPPGTGKTYTLSRIIAHHYKHHKKVLVLAHSNAAVDVLMLEVANLLQKKWQPGKIIRYGYSSNPTMLRHPTLLCSRLMESIDPSLADVKISPNSFQQLGKEQEENKKERRKLQQALLDETFIIGTTLTKAAMDSKINEKEYDLFLVDEASMAYTPQLAFAATLGRKMIICGDFKQLPPIAISSHKLVNHWLKEDIFHHAKIVKAIENKEIHPNLFMLTEQRRMHPAIASFTNKYVYDDKVHDHPSVTEKQAIADYKPYPTQAAILLDISTLRGITLYESATHSRFNLTSALVTIQLIHKAQQSDLSSIGVVTPYKAQAQLLNALIKDTIANPKNLIAATVHKFQGSERDMIIFDVVDGFPLARPGILFTNKENERLINVAITRTRGKYIQVMDCTYSKNRLPSSYTLSKLTTHLQHTKQSYEWEKQGISLLRDISEAKTRIILFASSPQTIATSIWEELHRSQTIITIISTQQQDIPLSRYDYVENDIPINVILIDKQVLWLDSIVRIQSPETISLLLTYLDIPLSHANTTHEKNISFRRSRDLRLSSYITTWIHCPYCSNQCTTTNIKGQFRMQCHYCGGILRMTEHLLNKYLQYVNATCQQCNGVIHAQEEEKNCYATCSRCDIVTKLTDLG